MSSVLFILLNGLMWASSYVVAHTYWRQSSIALLWLNTFLLYTSQITLTLMFLGVVARQLGPVPIFLLNASISLLLLFLLRKHLSEAATSFWQHGRCLSGELLKSRDFFLFLLLFLFFFQVLALLVKIYYFPPDVWDVFAYHLHPVVEWFQQNLIPGHIDTPVTRLNRNPMGPKLLSLWFIQFTGDLTWVELPQFLYGLVTMLAAYVLMIRLKVQRFSALKYAILIYFIPLVIIESRTVQDHLVLAAVSLLTLIYFSAIIYENQRASFLFLGLALGQLLGAKISGPQIIILLFPALLLCWGLNWRRIRDFLRQYRLYLLLCVLMMLLIGGYWYLKDILILKSYFNVLSNWPIKRIAMLLGLVSGCGALLGLILHRIQKKTSPTENPVKRFCLKKPVRYTLVVLLVGVVLVVGITQAGLVRIFLYEHQDPAPSLMDKSLRAQYPVLKYMHSRFAKNLWVFPFRVKDLGMYIEYTPDFLNQSGFGLAFFAFGLLAYGLMLLLVLTRKRHRRSLAGFLLVYSLLLLATYFLYYYSVANYRLFIFFPVIGLILWAYIASLLPFKTYQRKILDLILVVMVLFGLVVTIFEGNRDGNRWQQMFTLRDASSRSTIQYSPFLKGEDWQYMDLYMPATEPIGYLGHFDSWVFPYFDVQMKRRIYYLAVFQDFKLTALDARRSRLEMSAIFKEQLRARGIHYIHVNPQGVRNKDELKKKKIHLDCRSRSV